MRILQINNCHYPRGGADVVYLNTGRLLEENGHEVAYFSTNDEKNVSINDKEYFVSKLDYRNIRFSNKIKHSLDYIYNREAFKKIKLLVKEFKPDLAHVHLYYGGLTVSILKALRELDVPIVQTVHDYRLLCPAKLFLDKDHNICERCKGQQYWHCVLKRCSDGDIFQSSMITAEAYFWKYQIDPLELIDHFIFVSSFSRKKHIEHNKKFSNKSSYLYNFQSEHEEKGVHKKGNYIFFYGRLSIEKGLITLLNTSEINDFRLIIAGTGPLLENVTNHLKKYSNVSYVGFQTGKTLHDLLRNSSYVIVPSECYENNPMSIVEAFSMGIPVIGSHIGGIPELIQAGYNGFTFEPGNSRSMSKTINKALKLSTKSYRELSDNALKFANLNFNKKTHYNSLIGIYKNLLAQ